jgi:hypothetical protein
MINYNELYTQKTNDAFDNIEKAGIYKGRLIAVKISKQSQQFVEEGKEPKNLVSFLWDCKNKAGKSVHVSTKPCTISFTDKSTLPKIWENVGAADSLENYLKIVYDKNNNVKDIFATLDIKVDVKENGSFATVTKVLELEEPIKDFGITKVTDYDRKVYGVEAIDIDINPVYAGKEGQVVEAENEDELFARLANA